jgi:Cu(I)/Ag(I) efflux system membrane protein CusA/SilA
MIGGMASSTILTLVVIPAVYALIKEAGLRRQQGGGVVPARQAVEEVNDARH